LPAGTLADFSSSDESSESEVGANFLGCPSSEEESEESSLDSDAFEIDALSAPYGY